MTFYEHRTPPHPALEDAADRLLQRTGLLSKRRGLKTERQLRYKIRKETYNKPQLLNPSHCDDEILQNIYSELAHFAELSPLEFMAFGLYLFGCTFREIAINLKISRSRAHRIVRHSRHILRKAYKNYPYTGWYEVYLSETRRY